MVTNWRSECPMCEGRGAAAECAACGRGTPLSQASGALWRALERSEDEATTLAVGRALARVGGPEGAAALREWLVPRVPSALCPGAMASLLGELPDRDARAAATEIARANFADKKLSGRWECVLAGLPTPEAKVALIEALGHADETVCWSAIHAMLETWDEVPAEAAAALRRVLMEESASGEVQFCAAALLARMNDPEVGEQCAAGLAEALEDAEETVADSLAEPTIAAGILARRDDERAAGAWRFLLRRLEGGSEAILTLALPPLLERPSRELVDALVDGCLRRRPRTPSAVTFARAFRELTDPSLRAYAWERLGYLLGEGDPTAASGVLLTLVQAAGALGCGDAVPVLRRIAEGSEDAHLASATLEALARLGDPDAIDLCAERLLADDRDVLSADRLALAGALGEIVDAAGRARAVAPLLRALALPALARPAAEALAALCAWEGKAWEAEAEAALTPCPLSQYWERGIEDPFGVVEDEAFFVPEIAWDSNPGDCVESVRYSLAELPAAGPDIALMAETPEPETILPEPEVAPVPIPVAAAAPEPPAPVERVEVAPALAVPRVERVSPTLESALDAVSLMVADLERSLAQLPASFFRYGGDAAARLSKERAVMTLLCEEAQPALERLDGLGGAPEARQWAARAYFVKARLHHALTCDAAARSGADALRQRQRWDQAKLAEGAYWHVLSLAEADDARGRALFDLAVLLVETERGEEAATLFDKVVALFAGRDSDSPEGRLATAASRYGERLRGVDEEEPVSDGEVAARDQSWTGALHVARKALRAALVSAAGLATCGAFAWYAWTNGPTAAVATPVAQKPSAIAQIEVTRWQAKVRTHRTRRAEKVKTARRGERLTAIGRNERWWKVQFANGVTGWIPARYTREVQVQ